MQEIGIAHNNDTTPIVMGAGWKNESPSDMSLSNVDPKVQGWCMVCGEYFDIEFNLYIESLETPGTSDDESSVVTDYVLGAIIPYHSFVLGHLVPNHSDDPNMLLVCAENIRNTEIWYEDVSGPLLYLPRPLFQKTNVGRTPGTDLHLATKTIQKETRRATLLREPPALKAITSAIEREIQGKSQGIVHPYGG